MSDKLLRLLQAGERPPDPEGAPLAYIALMHACWQTEPERRPNFEDIVNSEVFEDLGDRAGDKNDPWCVLPEKGGD